MEQGPPTVAIIKLNIALLNCMNSRHAWQTKATWSNHYMEWWLSNLNEHNSKTICLPPNFNVVLVGPIGLAHIT
ncbi:unnamed protein product, partial [Linum tenue]